MEEKEQLEHAARKVQSDIDQMSSSYAEAVCAVQAMVSDPLLTTLPLPAVKCTSADPLPVLKVSDLDKLKKLNLQAASQIEKLDKKLAERKAELDLRRTAHQQSIE